MNNLSNFDDFFSGKAPVKKSFPTGEPKKTSDIAEDASAPLEIAKETAPEGEEKPEVKKFKVSRFADKHDEFLNDEQPKQKD